ncbi:DNA mismatch repair protein MutS [Thermaerobacter sp. PB12/4term]|uniref:DNA mismatch repair protein MutS n=1 Tax=Thermaerobacter sp. PB12/4term TaxID=2293838 RepID=UPI001FADAE87|nr:DNA mismatch repair protein MutS [Thermaerobacter sp. PB12/4term]
MAGAGDEPAATGPRAGPAAPARLAGPVAQDPVAQDPGDGTVPALQQAGSGLEAGSAGGGPQVLGLAYADVSTGEFTIAQLAGDDPLRLALDELARLQAAECLLGPGLEGPGAAKLEQALRERGCTVTRTPAGPWRLREAAAALAAQFGRPAVGQARAETGAAAVSAGGGLLAYLRATQKVDLEHLRRLRTDALGQWLAIDANSRRNLELVRRLRDGSRQGTLLDVLDLTETAMGRRLLRQWIERPLVDPAAISARLDAVEALVRDPFLRAGLRQLLAGMQDLPRLLGRVGYQQANARDLLGIARALERLPDLAAQLEGAAGAGPLGRLEAVRQALDPQLARLAARLRGALVDDPPAGITEGGLIRDGFHPEVDALRQAMAQGRHWIAALEARERERTGIKSLKVGFNKVFGYYIEVTRANRHLVPPDYERRQTLAGAERFVTPELKAMESRILGAEERLAALEHQLFLELRQEVAAAIPQLQATADALAELDVLAALAEAAARYGYVRPRLGSGRRLRIRAGRHPVLDRTLEGRFVPNDIDLDGEEERVMLITGPNMAGKSTFMRQVALIVIMAQMGSFVPAAEAEIGLVDRIFCRVGASDDLASGQSTFMVEVAETALAVHHATPRSLILLDEIGRGTSTFDGIAIARAVIEYIHDRIGARTLVSTHYHELTGLAATRPGIRNYHARVVEEGDSIRFLWRIAPGGADRSYGINVARLAGLPVEIVERAKAILAELDRRAGPRQLSLADLMASPVAASPSRDEPGTGPADVAGGAPPAGVPGSGGGGSLPAGPRPGAAAGEAGGMATTGRAGGEAPGTAGLGPGSPAEAPSGAGAPPGWSQAAAAREPGTGEPPGPAGVSGTGPRDPGAAPEPVAPAATATGAGAGAPAAGGMGAPAVPPAGERLARVWLEQLARLDLVRLTPLDAMNLLYAWQRRLKRLAEGGE